MGDSVEELAAAAVDCGLQVHRDLGPGLLESVYETVLAAMLAKRGINVQRQRPISFTYNGLVFTDAFRVDLILEDCLIIEVKSVETLAKAHAKQLLTYLRLSDLHLGLLMNFGAATFREGLKRIVNNHTDFASSRLRVHTSSSAQAAHWDRFFAEGPNRDFPPIEKIRGETK